MWEALAHPQIYRGTTSLELTFSIPSYFLPLRVLFLLSSLLFYLHSLSLFLLAFSYLSNPSSCDPQPEFLRAARSLTLSLMRGIRDTT